MRISKNEQELLAEAYEKIKEETYTIRRTPYEKNPRRLQSQEPSEDASFFKDKPEAPKDERQQSMSHVLKMSYDLNHYADLVLKAAQKLKDQELAQAGEKLTAMSSEIEDIYQKYLSV